MVTSSGGVGGRTAGALRIAVPGPAGVEREAVALRLDDGSGGIGWGEASPLPDYSPDRLEDVEAALDDWAARWERGAAPPVHEAFASLPAARCAADTAVLDLESRRRGLPLRTVLVEGVPTLRPVGRLPVAALVTLAGVERAGAPSAAGSPGSRPAVGVITQRVSEGYRTVKVKIGGPDFESELEQLAAIRAAFPYLRLRLDVNGGWTAAEARERLGVLKRVVAPELVEQPVGAEELLSFGNAGLPIAADESLRLPDALTELASPAGCAAVVLKPMVLGGPRACFRLGLDAFREGLRVIVSHTFGGPVAHAAACELALALGAADPAGEPPAAGLGGHEELPQRSGAWIVPADVAGHGVERPW